MKRLLLIPFVFILTTCSKVQNDGYPAYIYIDHIDLQTDYIKHGNNQFDGRAVWIEAGSEDLGAWELPARIPILQEGKVTIRIFPGIAKKAISDFGKYNFVNFYSQDVDLKKTVTDTIRPLVTYKDSVKVPYHEDFEKNPTFDNMNIVDNTSGNALRGLKMGKLLLNTGSASTEVKVYSKNEIPVPYGKEAYLEFDYSSLNDTSILYANLFFPTSNDNVVLGVIKCSSTWKRAYFPIDQTVGAKFGEAFKVMFVLIRKDGQLESSVLIDNVRVIYQ